MKGKRLLFRHLRRYVLWYGLAFLLLASANITFSFFPGVLGKFTDELQRDGLSRSFIQTSSLTLLAIALIYGLLFGLGQYLNHRLGRIFEFNTRQKLFRHFTKLSERYYSRNGIGKLLSLVMNDVTSVRESIANGANQLTNGVCLLASALVMMAMSDIPLYLVAICVIPLFAIPIIIIRIGPQVRSRSRQVQDGLASMTESAEEQFGGMRVTKAFGIERIARARFGEAVDTVQQRQLRLVRISALFQALLPFMGALSMVVAIVFGGMLAIDNKLSIGNFVALTLYLRMIMTPLQQIGNMINTMQRSRASIDRLDQLLTEQPDIVEADNAAGLPAGEVSIDIRGLSFTYPGARGTSLADVSFQARPGQTVGIVGKTGSGKTTLAKLLLRVYDPPRGTIRIAGTDILDLSLEGLRESIAYVPQDGFLFSTTIRDNIAFHNRQEAEDNVKRAAAAAEFYEQVRQLPAGFETKLGERGLTLSGGQRQRTSLARGLLKNAPILIMDDSVSAVDTITETSIIGNLGQMRHGKTTLIIAHRISAVKHADLIIVMDNGRIIEQGSYEDLLRQQGYFASLQALQEEGM